METVISLIALAILAAAWLGGKQYWHWRIRSGRAAVQVIRRNHGSGDDAFSKRKRPPP